MKIDQIRVPLPDKVRRLKCKIRGCTEHNTTYYGCFNRRRIRSRLTERLNFRIHNDWDSADVIWNYWRPSKYLKKAWQLKVKLEFLLAGPRIGDLLSYRGVEFMEVK